MVSGDIFEDLEDGPSLDSDQGHSIHGWKGCMVKCSRCGKTATSASALRKTQCRRPETVVQ